MARSAGRRGARARQRHSALANVWGPLLFEDSEGAEPHARQVGAVLAWHKALAVLLSVRQLQLMLNLAQHAGVLLRDLGG